MCVVGGSGGVEAKGEVESLCSHNGYVIIITLFMNVMPILITISYPNFPKVAKRNVSIV